ncbi:hypothetical protein Fmac_008097 [Flemingia macrophylla]|uniref:Uncharacterized protein n=1 Tax=Flemingia macrophylla TaxID=520843 RepID=A0ABD1MXB2_9FABA
MADGNGLAVPKLIPFQDMCKSLPIHHLFSSFFFSLCFHLWAPPPPRASASARLRLLLRLRVPQLPPLGTSNSACLCLHVPPPQCTFASASASVRFRLCLHLSVLLPPAASAFALPPPSRAQPERNNPCASTLGFPSSAYNFSSFCIRGSLQKADSRASSSSPFCKGLKFDSLCDLTHLVWMYKLVDPTNRGPREKVEGLLLQGLIEKYIIQLSTFLTYQSTKSYAINEHIKAQQHTHTTEEFKQKDRVLIRNSVLWANFINSPSSNCTCRDGTLCLQARLHAFLKPTPSSREGYLQRDSDAQVS